MSVKEWVSWVVVFGLLFVLGCVLVVFRIRDDILRGGIDTAIARGYTVYLDGVMVDTDKLDVDKYGFSIDYESHRVLLNSVSK